MNSTRLDPTPIPRHREGASARSSPLTVAGSDFSPETNCKKVAVSGGEPIELCAAPSPTVEAGGRTEQSFLPPTKADARCKVSENGGTPAAHRRHRNREVPSGGPTSCREGRPRSCQIPWLVWECFRWNGRLPPPGRTCRWRTVYADGHLIFARSGTLLAVPFDPERLAVTGPETCGPRGVRVRPGGPVVPQAVFSQDGRWSTRRAARDERRAARLGGSAGQVEPLGMPPRPYRRFSLSPGRTTPGALSSPIPEPDLWVCRIWSAAR